MGMTYTVRLLATAALSLALVTGCRSANVRDEQVRLAELEDFYRYWQGAQYQYGGSSRSGVDCSALVATAYQDVFNKNLPRTTDAQAKVGKRVRKSKLQAGDLVFFKTGWRSRHVGIYLEDGIFMHSSTSSGVIKSSLNSKYWREHYWKSRRVIR